MTGAPGPGDRFEAMAFELVPVFLGDGERLEPELSPPSGRPTLA